jgi:hypothetical protein
MKDYVAKLNVNFSFAKVLEDCDAFFHNLHQPNGNRDVIGL